MPILHKFLNHSINPETEILIIGTFNPDVAGNEVSFFYGRPRNFLWRYLPFAFNKEDLKYSTDGEKFDFMKKNKIDFIDLIKIVDVEVGQELNFDDNYLDGRIIEYNDILNLVANLKNLKKIIFTRSTFIGIPNIRLSIENIEQYCNIHDISTIRIISPARFWRNDRQLMWDNFIQL